MAFPIIGFDSVLHAAALLVPSGISSTPAADTGFSVDDLQDHRAFKIWRSSAATTPQTIDIDLGASGADNADYLALVNHNLKTLGADVEVLADSFTPPTTVRLAAFVPASDAVAYKSFTAPGNLRYWRLRLSKAGGFSAKPFIGELLLGLRTTLPEFMNPDLDPFMKQVEVVSSRSDGGHYLGATLRGVQRSADLRFGGDAGFARAFLTSDWNSFLDAHAYKRLPFVFVRDADDSDFSDPLWLRVPDGATLERLPVGGIYGRMVVRLPVEEALMEAA